MPEVLDRLQASITEHHFGVLGQIDLKTKMAEKGVPFEADCVILEVCNPQQAKKVLEQNLVISTSLPCRISVYDQAGRVMVATVKPTVLLDMYKGSESLKSTAEEVERTVIAIIDAACGS